jgi:hypothetical protein
MPPDDTPSTPEIRWTWSSASSGWLSTSIRPDGSVIQGRQFSPSSEPISEQIGKVSVDQARSIEELAAAALAAENPTDAAAAGPDDPALRREVFDLRVIGAGGARAARVAREDLERHPAMAQLRRAIIRARHRAGGGYLSWHNVGARLALAYLALALWMTYLSVSTTRNLARMQREAERLEATVTTRYGSSGFDKYKYLKVSLTPVGRSKAVIAKITDSLSADNWKAANPGAPVRVWYLPATGKTYLEDDIQRNLRDGTGSNSFLWIFSAIFVPLSVFLSRYRADTYPDGKEYMIHGDRVSLDGKAMPFSDSELLAVRALIRVAS